MADFGPTALTDQADWTLLTRGVAATGVRDDGVYVTPLSVFADSTAATVKVRPGIGMAGGLHYGRVSAVTNLTIANNAVAQPRTDSVVLRLSITAGTAFPVVVQGTAGTTAPAPALLNGPDVFDVWLADVAVPANYAGAAIPASWVTDRRLVVKNATRFPRGEIGYIERIVNAGPTAGATISSTGLSRYVPADRRLRVSAGAVLTNTTGGANTYDIHAFLSIDLSNVRFAFARQYLTGSASPNNATASVYIERTFTSTGRIYDFSLYLEAYGGGLVSTLAGATYPTWLRLDELGAV